MQVRVFESPDMASGLKQIKKELGPDALILSTRTVRGGALGLLGKPMLEITAAVDHDFTPAPGRQPGQAAKPPETGKEPRPGGFRQVVDDEVLPWLHQQPAKAEPQPPAPPAATAAPPASPAPRPPSPPSSDGQRLWFSAALQPTIDLGTLPAPAFGLGGSLAMRWYPIVARVGATWLVGVEETVDGRPDAGGDFDMWALYPGLCLTPWHTARAGSRRAWNVTVDLCTDLELGQMRGEGSGVRNPDAGSALWVTPLLSSQLELALHRWISLRVGLAAGAPLLRPDFVLQRVGIVHAANPIIGRGTIGAGAVF